MKASDYTYFGLDDGLKTLIMLASLRGNSSAGRAIPCQGIGREFESRFPLHEFSKLAYYGECNHAFAVLVSAGRKNQRSILF